MIIELFNYHIIFSIFFSSVNIYNLNFPKIIGNHNKKGLDINSLTSYKFTDNFSIDIVHEWINRKEFLDIFNLEEFYEKALYRTL